MKMTNVLYATKTIQIIVFVGKMTCGHYFHQGCQSWYSENYKCPVCNQDIR